MMKNDSHKDSRGVPVSGGGLSPAGVFDVLAALQQCWPVFGEPWPYAQPSFPLLSPWRDGKRFDLCGESWVDESDVRGRIRWCVCTGRKQWEYFDTPEQADSRLEELGWILVAPAEPATPTAGVPCQACGGTGEQDYSGGWRVRCPCLTCRPRDYERFDDAWNAEREEETRTRPRCGAATCVRSLNHLGMHHDGSIYWESPDTSEDDIALMCRKDPARAARTIRDLHQERLDHYSREARLMERIEDLERATPAAGQTPGGGER